MPRLAASGPISRLGPLSLLHWVFLLRPVRLFARSMGSGADGRAFPSAVDFVYCHRVQYAELELPCGCLRKSHVLYFGYAVHALKGSSFFLNRNGEIWIIVGLVVPKWSSV